MSERTPAPQPLPSQPAERDDRRAEVEDALREATQLAKILHATHYSEVTQWKPFDDLRGVISQIDNMTVGLVRGDTLTADRDRLKARVAELEKALEPFAQVANFEERAERFSSVMVNIDHCRAARQALKGEHA